MSLEHPVWCPYVIIGWKLLLFLLCCWWGEPTEELERIRSCSVRGQWLFGRARTHRVEFRPSQASAGRPGDEALCGDMDRMLSASSYIWGTHRTHRQSINMDTLTVVHFFQSRADTLLQYQQNSQWFICLTAKVSLLQVCTKSCWTVSCWASLRRTPLISQKNVRFSCIKIWVSVSLI